MICTRRPFHLMTRAAAAVLSLAMIASPNLAAAVGSIPADPVAEAALSALRFREIGPAVMGGRIADIAAVDADTFYAGAATGNLWKTTNRGTTWEPLFEDEDVNSIGDVTLAPSNPAIVWIGTGEANNRQSSPWGAGVYRSNDGGRNWKFMGLENTRHIGRILVHPTNPDVVYVAATGNLWAESEDRGVYHTEDGGETWEKVLYVDSDTGAIDIAMHPTDPNTVLAAMYQRRRTACCFVGGGPGSGLYRTTDGGDNWAEVEGLPAGDKGRIGLDFFRGDGNIAFAVVEAAPPARGVYRTSDGGATWEQTSDTNPRPMYYSQIRVDPQNSSRVYVLGVQLHVSDDGGVTFDSRAREVHSDHHAMWIDPENSNHVLMAGDGGVSISFDRATTWRFIDNLPIGQFYEIGVDLQMPYMVYGGLQDNGSWGGPSATLDARGIRNADWFNVHGGDGFYTRVVPDDPTVMFAESQSGNLSRVNLTTMERQGIRPVSRPDPPAMNDEESEDPEPYRFNWNSPVIISEHDYDTIYYGGNVLSRSHDRGYTWEEISPDLTRAIDREQEEIMGVNPVRGVLSLNDGVSNYGNITTISESPINADTVYVGTDDGFVQRTRDGGGSWVNLTETFPGLPERASVSRLAASSSVAGRVYATFDNHQAGDFLAYAYASDDYGDTWRPITAGLPDWSINIIVEHPRSPDLLFLGTEVGLYVSFDRGGQWQRLKNNLPTVPVDDIVIHPVANDLVLGTHGRSIWILDDITPLEHMAQAMATSGPFVFPVRDAVQYSIHSPQGWVGTAEYRAANPQQGALIRFMMPEPLTEPMDTGDADDAETESEAEESEEPVATLVIKDAAGELVRELEFESAAGLNEVVWDMRGAPPYEPDPNAPPRRGRFGGPPPGLKVMPGDYTVELALGDQVSTSTVRVHLDPRVSISAGDLELRQETMAKGQEFAAAYNDANQAVSRLTEQLGTARELIEGFDGVSEELGTMAEEATEAVRDVSELLQRERRVLFSAFGIERSHTRPTDDQIWAIDRARERLPDTIEQINEIITTMVPALWDKMNAEGLRPDPGAPIARPDWQR
ncbi:MAG: glycosyl hydrolase [Acidobacteria bacterium]|nr:glycosyl hydrolase [Acidobacteriota bacterium]